MPEQRADRQRRHTIDRPTEPVTRKGNSAAAPRSIVDDDRDGYVGNGCPPGLPP